MADKRPRLRFAPSPTGYLHIGGVRTALFNWLWARKTGGTFVLRIEDTDQERSTDENMALIVREMRWLGLEWDEGPEVGGEHGPYRQTEREALKATDPKAQFRYPGWWRDKGPKDWPSDQPYVIRLKVPESGHTSYHDLVFGEQSWPNSAQQDVVLVRSDGMPLYNFGCVVDDITMGITLVARGRDHMVNTPLQIMLYRALDREPPQFAHLPMMLGKGGAKLSKRHGAVSVGEYRDAGVPASGLLNYLVRFGWSFGDEEVFSLAELVDKFDWSRCNKSDGRFDPDKLTAIAFEHLKRPELTSEDAYVSGLLPLLRARYGVADEGKVRAVLPQVRPRARTLVEAAESLDWLFASELAYEDKARKKFLESERAAPLGPLCQEIAKVETFEAATLEAAVKSWAEAQGLALGAVAQPARVALTGRTVSPGLFEVMELLGRERTLARLEAAAAFAAAGSSAGA
jgi:glutamyl-tRNA synthetase